MQALSKAVSSLNVLISSTSDPAELQKILYVAQTIVSEDVAALVDGTTSVAQFEASTSLEALQGEVEQVQLPEGSQLNPDQGNAPPPPPVPAPPPPADSDDDNLALALGLGLGLGIPLVGMLAVGLVALRRRRA